MHTIKKQLNNNEHISERGFALDVETEKVLPNNEIEQDTPQLSNTNEINETIDSVQTESYLDQSENADIPSEAMNDAESNQIEFDSSAAVSSTDL